PTVLSVTSGTGAPAAMAASKKMNCSTGERPCPPYSLGQPMPSHPSAPIWRMTLRYISPPDSPKWIWDLTSGGSRPLKYSRSSARSASCSGVKTRRTLLIVPAEDEAARGDARACGHEHVFGAVDLIDRGAAHL